MIRASVRAAAIAAVALSTSPPAQAPSDSGHFTIYKLQHAVGAETWTLQTTEAQRALTVSWAFRYIGSDVRLRATLLSAADGAPQRLDAHGQTSTLTDVDLSVSVAKDSVTVTDRGKTRSFRNRSPAFPIFRYAPVALEEALFRYCCGASKSGTARLLPGGNATFEYR